MEIWKSIPDYENLYEASMIGNIKSLKRWGTNGKLLKQYRDKDGYLFVILSKKAKHRTIKSHRIIAKTFLKKIDGKSVVNHKNGIKNDNRVSNLEWVTIKENCNHAWKNGFFRKFLGNENWNSKKVYQYDMNGKFLKTWGSQREAELFYNINRCDVSNCVNGRQKSSGGFVWKNFLVE